ncbi:MAG: hypothetical protein ACXABG_17145, partial [Promethearchaeota archaeon]
LNEIRSGLKDTQIKDPKLVKHERKISKIEGTFKNASYKFVYDKLVEIANSNLGIKGIDTVSGCELFKTREELLWRILWIIGLHGKIEGSELNIDSATLYDNRKPISLPNSEEGWISLFDILSVYGISGDLEILTDKLYTPGGYMRAKVPKTNEPAYLVKMNVSPDLQKYPFFKILNDIFVELQKKSEKRAYSNFKKLNLNPILE